MKEFYLTATGGGRLHCCLWEPEGTPRGVVQIVHGVAEYVERYAHFAAFLTQNGFVVVGDDHTGHGKSAEGGTPGHFSGGWDEVVQDLRQLHEKVRAQYPTLPYFFYGHSMGSFLTRTYLYRYPDSGIRGAVLSGTAWHPKVELAAGQALCGLYRLLGCEKKKPKLVARLMFGSYCRPFPGEHSPNAWICGDPEVVARYDRDPMCAYGPTVGMSSAMLHGLWMNETPKNLRKMNRELPVFFLAGDRDPVGAMGRGVRKSAAAFRAAGIQNVTCKLYPGGRHEMHNEKNQDEVFADVLAWLEQNM